jgi:hypothetical protein
MDQDRDHRRFVHGNRQREQQRGDDDHAGLRGHQHRPAVTPVGDRAADERDDDHRPELEEPQQAHERR